MKKNIYQERQLKAPAVKLYKAYIYCLRRELILTYICIAFSALFYGLAVILNIIRIYLNDESSIAGIATVQNVISLLAGLYLIVQIFLLYFAGEFGKNKVSILEFFEQYIYKLKPNILMTRNISDIQVTEWSRKITLNDVAFCKKYYNFNEAVAENVFDNQVNTVTKHYGLLNFAFTRFYVYLWIGVGIISLIFAIIVGVNESFIDVLLSILIPSLGLITMVTNGFIKYLVQRKMVFTCLNALTSAEYQDKKITATSFDIRTLQDAIFQQRIVLMNIPFFITTSYEKKYCQDQTTQRVKKISHKELENYNNELKKQKKKD